MCISYTFVNIHIVRNIFDVFDWAFIKISIKDHKILISHINSWYLGWTTLKFQENPPNLVINTHCLLTS